MKLSFQSVNYPDRFVRHKNYQLWLDPNDGSDLFNSDATFRRRPGLADDRFISLESVNYPGCFIRHKNYRLWIDPHDGSGLFKHDATFRIDAALSSEPHPHLVRGVACLEVRNSQPWGLMGKAGTFPPGPITICRYMEFGEAGGRHDVELVAYWAPIGSQNYTQHSSRKDFIDDPTAQTSYTIWFSDRRDNGNWREQVFFDGRPLGIVEYLVGGVGE
jgi:hypothetical protein